MIKYNLPWVFSCLFVLALYLGWLAQKGGIASAAFGLAERSLRILWLGVALLPASIVWLTIALVALPKHLEYYLLFVSFLPFGTSVLMGVALSMIWMTEQVWRTREPAQK